MAKWLGEDVPKLGMGMMRLPVGKDGEIDHAQVAAIIDRFLEGGFSYVDTAFGYMGGKSEDAVRRALVERHPRERFLLATKLPPWELKTKEDRERVFATQLARTGAGYFDYYLLHSLGASRLEALDSLDAWGFLMRKKEEGLVRHLGFSFHDSAQVLEGILAAHPEMEFVQLQINYADWEDEGVQARLCYETARKYGRSVIIMEPVKGGALAALRDDARAVLEAARPGASPASWAMRYAASLEGVVTVLSGMSSLAQMEDNIRTISRFEPLTGEDRRALDKVRALLAAVPTISCTDCKYCVERCPRNIAIPGIFQTENRRLTYGFTDKGHYAFVTGGKGKASDCIKCGECESRCPQHLPIMELLEACRRTFDTGCR